MAQTSANGAGKGADPVQRDIDALSDQIAALRGDLSSLAELVGEIGQRRGKAAREALETRAQDLRGQGEEALRDAGRKVAEIEDGAAERIRATPFQAMGLAAAAGFLVGYLGARR
ncbi:DUF883 domain-containing protein [Salipiger sp. P9]|uniref:DUF883 family protein n=1 Tax=Salipiger pentaromativorans TaxID=2943193 RepID=UPI0021572952|nr:DUF883 domain-containing protein [Salipiger pentaromativorans]MCR8549891.1 DUF883 domain-containing protein [Salipiger pentaromativorans]